MSTKSNLDKSQIGAKTPKLNKSTSKSQGARPFSWIGGVEYRVDGYICESWKSLGI